MSRDSGPKPDESHSAEDQGVILRAELAAQGWDVDVPQPTPEDTKRAAVQHDEAGGEDS
jgi:hypothetical protein